MRRVSTGLRTRLLLLVLLAVIPAFGVIGYTATSQREQAALDAEQAATGLVRLAAREQARMVVATRELLINIAQLPAIYDRRGSLECNDRLAELHGGHPHYTNLGVVTPSGDLFCNSRPISRKINIADRSYFKRAVQTASFAVGDYQIGRVTGEPAINFGFPVYDPNGRLQSVVYAALNLTWLAQLLEGVDLPTGSTLSVIDGNGVVLGSYPGTKEWIGKSIQDSLLFRAVLNHSGKGTVEVPGFDGVKRLYAFAPLLDNSGGHVYVAVGIPTAVAFASANKNFQRSVILMLAAAALALMAAWIGGNVFILRRVKALTTAAGRLAKGDLTARSGLRHDTEELGLLARTFDDMAVALQRVNRAHKTLSAGNRTVVRAKDEQTLLEEMCRVIVEVGGYRLAWIGYAEHDEHKTVRVAAQFGFDGGIEALLKAVGNVSWADVDRGQGPAGSTIRTGKKGVIRNLRDDPNFAPWREEVTKRGYASCATFPLLVNDRAIGALSIYSQEADAFDAEELDLLDEAARDLSFGISVLRTRMEHDRAHATIERMSYYDALTGLPNHPHFETRLRESLVEAAPRNQLLGLFVIGLNRLREINDALGFHQGDVLLKEVGARIRAVVRGEAMVARMRGDEFSVLLPTHNVDEPAEVAQQIMNALAKPFTVGDLKIDLSAALGISLYPEHGTEAALLMRRADVAMQQAKRSGKNFGIYTGEQDGESARRLSMAGELRRAIEEDELLLYYQPKIDMRTNQVCGVEALVRWRHPSRGMIPPDEFIGLAEYTGLIKPLSSWVVNAALRQSSAWRQMGVKLPVAVNMSPRNLHDDELIYEMDQLFAAWRADPGWIEIEITEGAVMQDPDGALQVLKRLKAMGIMLFIDDFGTGYSSLGYLKKLPVDSVKIDKTFVSDMLADADSAAIVRSTIGLAHDLDLKVVAEGVESEAIMQMLTALGCDVAQGYHISKPMPPEQFPEWFERHATGARTRKVARRVPSN